MTYLDHFFTPENISICLPHKWMNFSFAKCKLSWNWRSAMDGSGKTNKSLFTTQLSLLQLINMNLEMTINLSLMLVCVWSISFFLVSPIYFLDCVLLPLFWRYILQICEGEQTVYFNWWNMEALILFGVTAVKQGN